MSHAQVESMGLGLAGLKLHWFLSMIQSVFILIDSVSQVSRCQFWDIWNMYHVYNNLHDYVYVIESTSFRMSW